MHSLSLFVDRICRSSAARTLALCLLCQGTIIDEVNAAGWEFSKQVSLQTSFSDNINLSDSDPKSDVFMSLTPGFVLQREGSHLTLDLAYAPSLLYYFSEESNNRIDNNLQANGQAEIFENYFFVDFSASARQSFIDSFTARGDAENTTGNVQTTYSYAIAPRLQSNLGRYAEVQLEVENNGVFYSAEGDDSYGYGANFQLRSRPDEFGRLLWGLQADTESVEYQSTETENDFSSVSVILGYELTRKLTIEFSGGYENNNYSSNEKTSGAQWAGSIFWVPTSRTSLRATYGEHYYGSSAIVEFEHQRKRSVWSLNYSRQLASARSQVGDTPVYAFEDPFGEPITPDLEANQPISVDNASATSDVFISDRLTAQYVLLGRRSTLTLNVNYDHRNYGSSASDQSAAQAGLDLQRRLSGKLSGFAGLSWRQTEQGNSGTSDNSNPNEEVSFRTGLSRSLSENMNLDLTYQLREGSDYSENRVTLGIATDW